jgi:tetratricopeptide (TPR) repeat protein
VSFWTRLLKGAKGEDSYQKGISLFNEGKYDQAVEVLEGVIAESKSRGSPIAKLGAFYAAEARAKIGIARFYRGEFSKAQEQFEAALAENPHYPDLYYYLGVVHHHSGNLDKAIENLRRATQLNAQYAEATCYLGIALHDAGFFEQAEEAFSRALELARKAPNPLSRILVDKLEGKSFDLPLVRELRAIVVENTEFENNVKEGASAFNRGDFRRAAELFSTAVGSKPGYPDIHCRLGIALLECDEVEEARVAFEKAVELNPEYVEAIYYLGVALAYCGDHVSSKSWLERAVSINSSYADVHCQLGLARLSLGELEGARDSLQRAIEISPHYAKAHYLLGLVLHAVGDEDGAAGELKQALRIQPNLFAAGMDAGLHAMYERKWEDAERIFQHLAESQPQPQHADVLCMLGAACLESGRLEDARRHLSEALELNPDFVEARKRLALVHYREGDYGAAERLIADAADGHRDYPDLRKILGDIHLKKGELAPAEDAYRESLNLNPDYADAVFGMVIALRREGRGREADRILRSFVERHPANLVARTLLTVDKMKLPDA